MTEPPEPTTDIAVLARLAGQRATGDVVDVGCGPGRLARELARRGARVTGIEVSDGQLADARAQTVDGTVDYAVGRAESLPLADGSADLVVLLRSLHHVPIEAMGDALHEARRVLRPGGAVYVAEPLAEGDFFAMVSIVEDETAVRDAARTTVAAAAERGLRTVVSERYEIAGRYADLDAFRDRMVSVEPDRATVFDARRDELARAFAAGTPDRDGGRVFAQAMRADLLERAPLG